MLTEPTREGTRFAAPSNGRRPHRPAQPHALARDPLKRAVDVVGGTVLCVLAAPAILLLAALVAFELRAWPFFVQERIGKGGALFRMPKLRTLPRTVDPYTDKHSFDGHGRDGVVGFLRRSHLDELPQLFLVPIGTMSLVGPRPKMPDWAEPIEREYGLLRTRVSPGCTGLWQIGQHAHYRVADTPIYDRLYIERRCFVLDLWIMWRTVCVLLGGRRSHANDIPASRRTRLEQRTEVFELVPAPAEVPSPIQLYGAAAD